MKKLKKIIKNWTLDETSISMTLFGIMDNIFFLRQNNYICKEEENYRIFLVRFDDNKIVFLYLFIKFRF